MMTLTNSSRKVSGVFGVVEVEGGFAVRDPYGVADAKVFKSIEQAQRCSDSANRTMKEINSGEFVCSNGGDI